VSSQDKPKEFEVIKPAPPQTVANPISPTSELIAGRIKDWDKFLGAISQVEGYCIVNLP
jgi:hypothetical protein